MIRYTKTKRAIEERIAQMKAKRARLVAYLIDKVSDEDWHGVADAANDLRELDATLYALAWVLVV